ncbi:uracil-DNA glycosylase [Caulobacter sp. 17J80-11]|uniref:uracil-DNA glycosylase n=1 Tax=Caulobacter sp. 17J80-11 TaxID=2763502 RepID=UPI001653A978|nr:uracil-DNA glycosylase [Caulobacter sp. 17J80-11]
MHSSPDPVDLRALESLFAFWRDAGVEAAFADEPVDRTLAPPRPEPAKPVLQAVSPVLRGAPDLSDALLEARRLAADAQSLEQLEAALASFETCPLAYEGAKRPVFMRGSTTPDVVVIGEAPSADDEAQGRPFAGAPGRLLDRMLAAAGLTERALITHTVFWRPPGDRPPSPQEQDVCAPFLERTISLTRPRLLLVVGAASARSVLKKDEGILSLRGRWGEWRAEDGALALPALPTLHPAFLLRQPLAKKKAWADLLSLTARLDPLAS